LIVVAFHPSSFSLHPFPMIETWIQTAGGRQVWLDKPTPESIDPADLAHHLGQCGRFAGAARSFYSVAQHSVHCSCNCADPVAALLHDAAEAYLGDWTKPLKTLVKQLCPEVLQFEKRLLAVIAARFEIDPARFASAEVEETDRQMLATEKRDLLGASPAPWEKLPPPYGFKIICWPAEEASFQFMRRLRELGIK
jgi:uncharacterized protein